MQRMRLWKALRGMMPLLLCAAPLANLAWPTTHALVLSDEGVWLVSDTLRVHNDGSHLTAHMLCKAYISPNRIMFNAGGFRDLDALVRAEVSLPLEDPQITAKKAIHLMGENHQDLPAKMLNNPSLTPQMGGVIQVREGHFEAALFNLSVNLVNGYYRSITLQLGVPHGFGTEVEKMREIAAHDPKVAARIAHHPKAELLKLVKAEASERPGQVRGPFTVLLLRKDGTIVDFSDTSVCKNPHGLAL